MTNCVWTVGILCLLLVAPAAGQQPSPAQAAPAPEKTELLEQIIVKINGEIITKTDLESRQVAALRQRGQQLSDEELSKAIAELTPEILIDAVDELLLLQRGKELGYRVTDEQFKRVLENIRKENKLENDQQFETALKQEGLTLGELRRNLEKQMVINQVQQVEVMSRVAVSEAEARAYYEANTREFTTPKTVTLRELVVNVQAEGAMINVAADEAARDKVEAVLARIKAGESFEKIVGEISDSPSKANGGLVGPLNEDELAADIRTLIDPLKPGEVTSVFRTPRGYAVFKLESVTQSEIKAFDAARDDIADRVFQTKRRGEFEKYIRKLRGQAIIEWKNAEMQKLYNARLNAPNAAGLREEIR
ncbi:MAG: peptidyl-prolyl cis-trans isomerase [Acidobacteriota bacterium]